MPNTDETVLLGGVWSSRRRLRRRVVATSRTWLEEERSARLALDQSRRCAGDATTNLTAHQKATGYGDLYVHDRRSGQTSLLSVALDDHTTGDGPSDSYGLSGDGGTLVFLSAAPDLVAGDTTTFPPELFVASVPRH
jgi:hypothetical protein